MFPPAGREGVRPPQCRIRHAVGGRKRGRHAGFLTLVEAWC